MKFSRMLAAAGLALALASGTNMGAKAADPVKIRIAWVVPQGNLPSIMEEVPAGVLKHAGKTYLPELVHFQGTPPMITALASNDIDIGDLAYSSLALAIENGGMKDLRVIADESEDGYENYGTSPFMVRNDSGIKKVEDLKGKTIAGVGAGSAVDIAMRAMLKKHGLGDHDYTSIEAAFPNMKALLLQKKADMISEVLPFMLDPELTSQAHALFTVKDILGPSQFIVWTAKQDFIKKNRAAMVDFLEDSMRSWQWFLDPKNRDAALAISAKVSNLPTKAFADWAFTGKDNYRSPTLMPNLPGLQRAWDAQKSVGLMKTSLKVDQYSDVSMVKEAAARLK